MVGSQDANPLLVSTRRKSIFYEECLRDNEASRRPEPSPAPTRPSRLLRFNSKPEVFEYPCGEDSETEVKGSETITALDKDDFLVQHTITEHTLIRAESQGSSVIYRLCAAALVLAISVPLIQGVPWFGHASAPAFGATGGVIRRSPNPILDVETELVRRDTSPTAVCTRWSHQTALVNGTLYIYGGQATMEPGQTQNTWNNDFLSLDLYSSWQISSPSLTGLTQPSGPPNVSNAALWNSYDSLYLYGGEFSWQPVEYPPAFSMWEYDLSNSSWTEFADPTTSTGNNSGPANQSVQRAAEGAGLSVPSLGRGYYFGGHQDGYTTQGWSQWIYRVYLQSLLEFTMPGYQNTQVDTLSNNQVASTGGVWRNITEGGAQSEAGFPERADGLLLYVPGFGASGILIGLAGGTNTTLQQMNIIDIFDIATSTWYKQATSGSTPEIRVNPCAVVAAAPDGSSYNVFMFGGQNLQPAGNQTQYDDMWILTIPSFTWIQVDQSSQSVPYGRSGHTCNIWDGQMVVVGGYVGADISCDSPGIYVFDLSALKWVNQFTASSPGSSSSGSSPSSGGSSSGGSSTASGAKSSPSEFASNSETNPFNQQPAQLANSSSPGGLEGSYGYLVASSIISVIGGASTGGATITAPVATATDGPLKTGKPVTYTVTQSNGATVTETGTASSGNGTTSSSGNSDNSKTSGLNVAVIVAGTIAGLLLLLVCYLAFCTWLYRKRLQLYRRHLEMTQAAHNNGEKAALVADTLPQGPFWAASNSSAKSSSDRRRGIGSDGVKLSTEVSQTRSGSGSGSGGAAAGYSGEGYSSVRRNSSGAGSVEELLGGSEPTLWGTMLAPRKSLKVVNRD